MARRGDPFRQIRMPTDMWDAFGAAVKEGEPELDRSKVIRLFVRYYIGETDEFPRRPRPRKRQER